MDSGILSSCSVASLILRPGSPWAERGSCALNAGLQPREQLLGQDVVPSSHRRRLDSRRCAGRGGRTRALCEEGKGACVPWRTVCGCPQPPPVRTDLGTSAHSGVLTSLGAQGGMSMRGVDLHFRTAAACQPSSRTSMPQNVPYKCP